MVGDQLWQLNVCCHGFLYTGALSNTAKLVVERKGSMRQCHRLETELEPGTVKPNLYHQLERFPLQRPPALGSNNADKITMCELCACTSRQQDFNVIVFPLGAALLNNITLSQ